MREIPLSEFVDAYEDGLLSEVIVVKDRIYGRAHNDSEGNSFVIGDVVFSVVP